MQSSKTRKRLINISNNIINMFDANAELVPRHHHASNINQNKNSMQSSKTRKRLINISNNIINMLNAN